MNNTNDSTTLHPDTATMSNTIKTFKKSLSSRLQKIKKPIYLAYFNFQVKRKMKKSR